MIYHIGMRFKQRGTGAEYILAQVGYHKITLVSLKDGNRFVDPVEVRMCDRITPIEWKLITMEFEDEFILIE